MAFQLRLPTDKLVRLIAELNTAISRMCMKKHNLQSLTGLLQHATKVIWSVWPFLEDSMLYSQWVACHIIISI